MIPWLRPGDSFPPVETALESPNGLLAASREIDADQVLTAYGSGIFPWFSEADPVLWWSPDPRMVLFVDEFKVSRSLRKRLRRVAHDDDLQIRVDFAFADVMRACSEPRFGQDGTWITESMVAAYTELHQRSFAHSIEVWRSDQLVGGLYGVAIRRAFFGESMFSRESDASKIGLAALVALLRLEEVRMIDCQQRTAHLASLGAREIDRDEFCNLVRTATSDPAINWGRYAAARNDLLSGY